MLGSKTCKGQTAMACSHLHYSRRESQRLAHERVQCSRERKRAVVQNRAHNSFTLRLAFVKWCKSHHSLLTQQQEKH